MGISIDAMLSDLDSVRYCVLQLDPEDALRIEFELFSRAFPYFIAPPQTDILALSLRRLSELPTFDADMFSAIQSSVKDWSEDLSLT